MVPALADYSCPLSRGRLVLLYLFGALAALCLCSECVPWQNSDDCRTAFDTSFISTRIFAVPVCRAALSIRLARQQQPIFALYHGGLFGHILSGRALFVRSTEVR